MKTKGFNFDLWVPNEMKILTGTLMERGILEDAWREVPKLRISITPFNYVQRWEWAAAGGFIWLTEIKTRYIYIYMCIFYISDNMQVCASYHFLKPYERIPFFRVSIAVRITYFCIGYPEIFLARECL